MQASPPWTRDDAGNVGRVKLAVHRALALIPDPRARAAAHHRAGIALNRGDRVQCPICGSRFSQFMWAWNRPGAICWRCGSHERHRALWIWLNGGRSALPRARDLLHFSPEHCLEGRLRELVGPGYRSSELEPGRADLALDLTALDLPAESFDAVIASHVLEHVADDAAAMRELRRILRPGGVAVVMVPIDLSLTETFEDPSISSPEARTAAFWQADHVRLYAPDVEDRLRAAGFEVTVVQPAAELGEQAARRFGLHADERLFACRRPPAGQGAGEVSAVGRSAEPPGRVSSSSS